MSTFELWLELAWLGAKCKGKTYFDFSENVPGKAEKKSGIKYLLAMGIATMDKRNLTNYGDTLSGTWTIICKIAFVHCSNIYGKQLFDTTFFHGSSGYIFTEIKICTGSANSN